MFHPRKIKSSFSHSLNKVEIQDELFQWFSIEKHFFFLGEKFGVYSCNKQKPVGYFMDRTKKGEKLPLNLIQVKNKWMEMSDFDNKILFLLNRCSRSLQNARAIINKCHSISNTNCNITPHYAKLTMLKLVVENVHSKCPEQHYLNKHFYVSCAALTEVKTSSRKFLFPNLNMKNVNVFFEYV